MEKSEKKTAAYDITQYITYIATSIILGIAAGSGAILFHFLLEKMRLLFDPQNIQHVFGLNKYIVIGIPVLGGCFYGAMTHFFPAIAKERGVESVIKSILVNKGYIPLKVTIFHMAASILSIGTGVPLGPEGPVAKIGSGIGSFMSQIFRTNRKDMAMYTAAGAGAAISAIFNAPIAGVFFGIEVILLNDLRNRALSALIISSVIANVLSHAILGSEPIFKIPFYHSGSLTEYPFFLGMGLIIGLLCLFFFYAQKGCNGLFKKLAIQNDFIKILPVSLVFGIVLIFYYQLFGIGYEAINDIFNRTLAVEDIAVLFILKFIFVIVFLVSGAYGGIFAPSLTLGAFSGYLFAYSMNWLFNISLDPISFALVGMGGFLSGMNSIPLTAIMLVFELTNDYRFILPLMLVAIISYLVTMIVNKGTVYSKKLLEEGIDVTRRGEMDLLGKINVEKLMRKEFDIVKHTASMQQLINIIINSRMGDLFVVNKNNAYKGMISLRDIRQAIVDKTLTDLLIADDMCISVPAVKAAEPVSTAMGRFHRYDVDSIPVVNDNESGQIIGVLTYQDVLQSYNTLLEEWELNQAIVSYKK